jgi:hypothetical protein
MKQLLTVIGLILVVTFGYAQPEFDFVYGQTIYFKDKTSVRTNLCDLHFIGQIVANDSIRFLIVSGKACPSATARIWIYLQRPVDGCLTISSESSFYSYPINQYNKDGSLFSESRAFYGEVLPGRHGIIWFHKIYSGPDQWKPAVFLAEIKNEKIVESNSAELFSKTLEQVNVNKAHEIKVLISNATQSQPDSTMNKRTYHAWVKIYNKNRLTEGMLYDIKDSSISVSISYPVMFRNRNESITTIPVNSIEDIKLRRNGSIGKGILIGGLTGILFGALISYSYAQKDSKGTGVYVYPIMVTGCGVGLGAMFGSIKIKIPIHGNQDNFNYKKQELNRYAKHRIY